jgi:hypothetical protein
MGSVAPGTAATTRELTPRSAPAGLARRPAPGQSPSSHSSARRAAPGRWAGRLAAACRDHSGSWFPGWSCRRSRRSSNPPGNSRRGSPERPAPLPLLRRLPGRRTELPGAIRERRWPALGHRRRRARHAPADRSWRLAAPACRAANQDLRRRRHPRPRSRPTRADPRPALRARPSLCRSSRRATCPPPRAQGWRQPWGRRTRVSRQAADWLRALPLASDGSSICIRRSCGGPVGLRARARLDDRRANMHPAHTTDRPRPLLGSDRPLFVARLACPRAPSSSRYRRRPDPKPPWPIF